MPTEIIASIGSLAAIIILSTVTQSVNSIIPIADAEHFTSDSLNISNTTGDSRNARFALFGSHVYVVWQDSSTGNEEILFSKSSDGGTTFDMEPTNLSNNTGSSTDPQIAVSGSNVYVVWQDRTDLNTGLSTNNREIFFVRSTDAGDSFDDVVNFSNNTGSSTLPVIASSGDNVYVSWVDRTGLTGISTDIFFRASTNTGDSFGSVADLSNNPDISNDPQLSTSDSNVYVVWQDREFGNDNIFFLRSIDNGATFDADKDGVQDQPSNLSNNSSASFSPKVAVSGSVLYLAWLGSDGVTFKRLLNDGATLDEPSVILSNDFDIGFGSQIAISSSKIYVSWVSGSSDILLKKIIVNGTSLDLTAGITDVSEGLGTSVEPQIAVSDNGSNIYIVWQDDHLGLANTEIFFSAISDDGINMTLSCPINISNTDSGSSSPSLALSGGDIFILWQDFTPGSPDIFFAADPAFQAKSVALDLIDNIAPKWGLDSVTISGRVVNHAASDQVLIDWGDGSSPETATVSGCFWSSTASHHYGSSAVGANKIQVQLKDSSDTLIDTDLFAIEVMKHSTLLELDQVASVKVGESVTVTGSLLDTDSGSPVPNATISFDGEGADNIVPVTTGANGIFSSSGAAPAEPADSLTVKAHFAENSLYLGYNTDPQTYDTAEQNATEISIIGTGLVHLDLSVNPYNFTGLAVDFEDIASPGVVFVSSCTAPRSDRYSEVVENRCFRISSGVQLASGTSMLIHIDYAGLVGTGLLEDVDLFVESAGAVTDLTQLRQIDTSHPDDQIQIVTGKTGITGKFFAAIADHGSKPANALRSQILIGDGNEVLFRNYTSSLPGDADLTMDSTGYRLGQSATITVHDPEKDLDIFQKNTVLANVISDSDSNGVKIALVETGDNTGVFKGSVEITDQNSDADSVKAKVGDHITVLYQPSGARLRVVVDDVIESGIIEITDSVIPLEEEQSFLQTGGAFNINLIDAHIGSNGLLTVKASYANLPMDGFGKIFGSDPSELRLFHEEEFTQWIDITSEVNTDEMTVTGQTTTAGRFSLGFDTGGPGGCGGGCALPGTGVVLDFSAGILETSPDASKNVDGGGSSGGGHRSATIVQTISGNDVEIAASTASGPVIFRFESVEAGSGQLKIESAELSKFSQTFDEIAPAAQGNAHGILHLGNTNYFTTGTIFDIDASNVKFEGSVDVTIPYNEEEALAQGSESNVRFLHYDEEQRKWEDLTIDINSEQNSVTGVMHSLSPVVAAVGNDGTFAAAYFEMNQLGKITTNAARIADKAHIGERLSIPTEIKNVQRVNQTYALLVQIVDQDGVARSISWQVGSLAGGQGIEVDNNWIAEDSGMYTIHIFVWDSVKSPAPLSSVALKQIRIT